MPQPVARPLDGILLPGFGGLVPHQNRQEHASRFIGSLVSQPSGRLRRIRPTLVSPHCRHWRLHVGADWRFRRRPLGRDTSGSIILLALDSALSGPRHPAITAPGMGITGFHGQAVC